MKILFQKSAALLLAVFLLATLSVPAFAAAPGKEAPAADTSGGEESGSLLPVDPPRGTGVQPAAGESVYFNTTVTLAKNSAGTTGYQVKWNTTDTLCSSFDFYYVYRATTLGDSKIYKNGKGGYLANDGSTRLTRSVFDDGTTLGALVPGTRYYYSVTGVIGDPAHTSTWQMTQPYTGTCDQTIPLPAPTSVKAAGVKYNKIKVTFTRASGVSGVTGYEVYRAIGWGSSFSKVKTLPASASSYTSGALQGNKVYRYKVRTVGQYGSSTQYSAFTDSVSAIPKGVSKPGSFKAKAYNYEKVKLTWKKSSGASGYYVYRATSYSGNYKKIATLSKSKSSYKSKVAYCKKYYYKVVPYRTIGGKKYTGTETTAKNATTKKLGQAKNGSLYVDMASGRYRLSWSRVKGATGYVIFYDGSYRLATTKKTSILLSPDVNVYGPKFYVVPYRKSSKNVSYTQAKYPIILNYSP